jgi:hypothetical protein
MYTDIYLLVIIKGMNKSDFYIYLILTIIAVMLGYIVIKYCFIDNVSPFVSEVDGQHYAIRKVGNTSTKQTAANYLATLNDKINKLVDYMYKNKLPDADTANRLYYRWSKCELKETNSTEKSAAYTLNKSTEIRICIRDNHNNFENINTSMFVILHELGHVMSVSYGHGEEFKNNFSYITHMASKLGLYKPEDFINNPKTYCGTQINSTPCISGSCNI